MAESPYRKKATPVPPPPPHNPENNDEVLLARRVSWILPLVSAAAAIAVGVVTSAGPAILVLVGGAILGTIAALWASVRTLAGDAPVDPNMLVPLASVATSGALERKARVLRALKDLEHEHSVGKIDDDDYEALSAQYRAEAKKVLREIDAELGPNMARAEELAQRYLEKRGLGAEAEAREVRPDHEDDADEGDEEVDEVERVACPKCDAQNEPDAAFCKSCGAKMKRPKPTEKTAPKTAPKAEARAESDDTKNDDAHDEENDADDNESDDADDHETREDRPQTEEKPSDDADEDDEDEND